MRRDRLDAIWYGDDTRSHLARTILTGPSVLYGLVTSARNAMYDRGLLATHRPPVPALSLGNLSAGGTGKTPVAAWAARALVARGGHPAIVMRGYGDDEPLVHARLNPGVPVVVDADRVRGAVSAAHQGADCVVLDDAFQHRRIARVADWVLVSAEQWRTGAMVLPAGPLREPTGALRRAHIVLVTRKTASLDAAEAIAQRLSREVPSGACAVVHLAPDALVARDGTRTSLSALAGRRYVAVAGVGAPAAFFAQLRSLGAEVVEVALDDHHRFSAGEVRALARRAGGMDGVLCTLKDAVKLAPHWRGADAPLWYVSQAAVVDRGDNCLDASLDAVLAARVHS